jgi:serine/threonine protein phosphatase PrpC
MQITTRPYGGKLFRPSPEVHVSDDQSLVIIATPWGNTDIAKDFINGVTSIWRESTQDSEKTTTYAPDDGLSQAEHLFKMAVLAVHEDLKEKYNEDELSAGLEILCLLRHQEKISWFHVGAPSLVLIRDKSMMPLFHSIDFSHDFSAPEETLAPLPKELLGVQQQVNLNVGGMKLQKGDRFFMVSRSHIPSEFFRTLSPETISLDEASLLLAKDNENQPFWLGLLLMD